MITKDTITLNEEQIAILNSIIKTNESYLDVKYGAFKSLNEQDQEDLQIGYLNVLSQLIDCLELKLKLNQ